MIWNKIFNKHEQAGLKHRKDPKAFIGHSNDMQDAYKTIDGYNPGKRRKILIIFDDTIADMITNKKPNSIVTELFIWGRKPNISLVFITQWYFIKDVRSNSTHYIILDISKKKRASTNCN